MRFTPAAAALSLALALTASVGFGAERTPDPRAVALAEEGRAQMAGGAVQDAIDSFEAALVLDPAYTAVFLDLGEAARAEGLQGKAIRYYREALSREPGNLAALSGEGAALAEKGAIERARRNLAQLQSLCGDGCAETRQLATAVQRGPLPGNVMTAEAVTPETTVTAN